MPSTINCPFCCTPQAPTHQDPLTVPPILPRNATDLIWTLLNSPGLWQQTPRCFSVSSVNPVNSILHFARRKNVVKAKVTSGSKQDGEVTEGGG